MDHDASTSERDAYWMAHALRLAERGLWTTTPNPRVGCVIVQKEKCVGEGWHQRAGEPHAEVYALHHAGELARGATVYVTLEPCAHFGRTPPCADALIAAGVGRVVIALKDPNPLVAGRGIAKLEAAGIPCTVGVHAQAAHELNLGFIQRMTEHRPWVRLKVAASLDGRMALADGRSQWITGETAREDGHHWRARACAILTGIGTVLADNPRLNVRLPGVTRHPQRIVVDSHFRIPAQAQILEGGAWVVGAVDYPDRIAQLKALGIETHLLPDATGHRVDLRQLISFLADRGINELHVEAGPALNGALIQAQCVDELLLYSAPKLIGNTGQGLFDFAPLRDLAEAPMLKVVEITPLGNDFCIRARIQHILDRETSA